MMYKAEFELEAITPIFMRGANQNRAEIRAPSIKGVMRWWFRALAGNYFGSDIVGLRKAEEYVFGSTNQRNRVEVHVDCNQKPRDIIVKFKGNRPIFDKYSHIHELPYIWFSLKILASKGQIKRYYPAGTKFTIKLRSPDHKSFKIALATFWTLVTLGNIGSRNRRGAGSFKFTGGDLDILKDLSLKWTYATINDLRESILKAIDIIRLELGVQPRGNLKPQPYPILNEKTSFIGLLDTKAQDPIQALREFQNKYKTFRQKSVSKKDRIIFGLPINLRGKDIQEISGLQSKLKNSRRASPMILGVTSVGGKTHIRVVKFKTNPYHPDMELNRFSDWNIMGLFDKNIQEFPVFGSLEVFK
ncbi:MAG: Uncharacterized protein XD43_0031 [Thermococcales archaeon 44_46]|jgi:CRISPR-associated protein Cmr1|nr:MAG: Uncharacterized protein XD43_0031 [Thermococcales archaeon 44_46]MDK2782927.1 CRISPR-associated protein Cmr1 [Thermococcaceae archaeon]